MKKREKKIMYRVGTKQFLCVVIFNLIQDKFFLMLVKVNLEK